MNSGGSDRSVLGLLNKSASYLAAKGSQSPRLDAELLLSDILGLSRIQLYIDFERQLLESEVDAYRQAIMRRGRREPVAYIRGHKEFLGRDFSVFAGTLVPRPETELMVERAVEALRGNDSPNIAEVCCGTGAPGISVALEVPGSTLLLSDISEDAVAAAETNIGLHRISGRASAIRSDLFGEWAQDKRGSFDLIMANPPYIRSGDIDSLEPEISVHEPRLALDGGDDGLGFYARIAKGALSWLRHGGSIVLEMGFKQAEHVSRILSEAGYADIAVYKDLAGIDRVAEARR